MIEIKSKNFSSGIVVTFRKKDYAIEYPTKEWNRLPSETQLALRDNLALATTMHLPLVLEDDYIKYDTPRPILEAYFYENFVKDIPSCTDVDETDTSDAIRRFYNTIYAFNEGSMTTPSSTPVDNPERAIIGMSFGKDSLLTYAVAAELGLEPEVVYVIEESLTYEEKHKRLLSEGFAKEFGKTVHILHHDTGKLRDYSHLGLPKSEFGWGLQSTEYALEFIPFAYAYNGGYILFGNEQTTSETYMDAKKEWTIHPCFDQSHEWTIHIDQMTRLFSGGSVRTGSLIEPLMDMMVQRILVHRYPEIAKYQMSCFTETESGRDYRWCHDCSVCAKMYLLCAASGMNPKDVGFKENMLESRHQKFFTLFGGRSELTYANTETAHDEQLFGLYCAAKKGNHGSLIEEFKKSDLYDEAKAREDELWKRFISIYEPISVPESLREDVLSIYREEIVSFEL